MKIRIIYFLILLASSSLHAQDDLKGFVIDANNNEPVFGANIIINKSIVSITDSNGSFKLNLKDFDSNDQLIISHISYKTKKLDLLDLDQDKPLKILLEENIESLAEVTINKLSNEEIKKRIFKQFKEHYKYEPYLSKIKYDQIIKNKDDVLSLFQADGYLFSPMNLNNPFNHANLLPTEIRRTKEITQISKKWFTMGRNVKFNYNQISGLFARTHWTNFGFMETFHPLRKKSTKFYSYKLIGSKYINGEKYYILNFQQKKPISKKQWHISHAYGQVLINYDDFLPHSISFNFKFDNISYNSYEVQYSLHEDRLFPTQINILNFRYNKEDRDVENIVIEGQLNFENYKNFNLTINPLYYWLSIETEYNPDYWDKRKFLNENFKNIINNWSSEVNLKELFKEGYIQGDLNDKNKLSPEQIKEFRKSLIEFKNIIRNEN